MKRKSQGFLSSIVTILFGNVATQMIGLMAIPIVTRIYSPQEYGKLTIIWAVIALIGAISCLKYEDTIIIEKDNFNARAIFYNCIFIAITFSLLTWVILKCYESYYGLNYFNILYTPEFISIGILAFGLSKSYNAWVIRNKKFKVYSFFLVIGAIVSAFCKISLGFYFFSKSEFLLLGNLVGLFLPVICVFIYLELRKKNPLEPMKWNDRLNMLKKYSAFPRTQAFNTFVNAIQQQAPILILANYFDSNIMGLYGLSVAIMMRPVNALTSSISKVYLQKLSNQKATDHHEGLIKIVLRLVIVSFIPCALIVAFGETLFGYVLGEEWSDSGVIASLLVPWLFIIVIKAPITQVLLIRKRLRYILLFNIIYLISRVTGILLSNYYFHDFYMVILVFSLVGFTFNLFYIYTGIKVSKSAVSILQ